MCGIAGIISNLDNSCIKSNLTKMINLLEHRGPDDVQMYFEKQFGFATARLSIEALEEGFQPITDGRFVIGFIRFV